jgi:hypothetical protein
VMNASGGNHPVTSAATTPTKRDDEPHPQDPARTPAPEPNPRSRAAPRPTRRTASTGG